jgi:hypothetical protein
MSDQPLTIEAINWREAFPFTHLFRAFRVAIHPSKIVLGMVALLLLFGGGRVLDGFWPIRDRAVPGEASLYESAHQQANPGTIFSEQRNKIRSDIEARYAGELVRWHLVSGADAARAAAGGENVSAMKAAIIAERDKNVADATTVRDAATAAADKLSGQQREQAEADAQNHYEQARLAAYEDANTEFEQDKTIKGEGLFEHYFGYESNQVSHVVRGVCQWNWFGRESVAGDNPLASYSEPGVIQSLLRFFTVGPLWLLMQHPLYFILFGIYSLVLWAIFGGAISRIAAVHVARDQKMSIRSALRFSISKFLSFLFAPIIPLLIILALGVIVTIGSVLGNIPFFGPIIVGALFFLALAAGFVMTLVLLGLLGGFNLMYPTIAVEGSDSFDAISRSFSYLYALPWRLAFYTVVAVIYGALAYLFVRLFIFLMLAMAHKFVGMGMFVHANSTAPLWAAMWPSPATAARLSYDVDFLTLSPGQSLGAFLISFWVYLVITILGAFAISFYFSANTIIYYLMRQEADTTAMDDVYLEQLDDEIPELSAAAPASAAGPIAEVPQTGPASDSVNNPDGPPST